MGTDHNPSDVLTKFVQAAVLVSVFQSSTSSKIQVCLRCSSIAQVSRRSRQSSQQRKMTVSMRIWWTMHIQFFQEYINKLAVNTTVSAFQVRFVCWISILFNCHLEIQSCFHSNQTCIHATSASRGRILRAKRLKRFWHFNS